MNPRAPALHCDAALTQPPPLLRLDPHDEGYPSPLLELDLPPVLTVSGPLVPTPIVAIVGSRQADLHAMNFAHQLAYHFAKAGFVVASGGAQGIDWAAHRGAVRGGGATWCVACTGSSSAYPSKHAALFEGIARSKRSRMIWPFADATRMSRATPRFRNGVLVGLASIVIVVQARSMSGSLNAATWAGLLGRALYVVPGAPWDTRFDGSTSLLAGGAKPLFSIAPLFTELGLSQPDLDDPRAVFSGMKPQSPPVRHLKKRARRRFQPREIPVDTTGLSRDENQVYSHVSKAPTQQDKIIAETGLGASSTLTALLTLSLKDVVVEGPDGFFRRRTA